MKYPKNRANLFLVERVSFTTHEQDDYSTITVVVGAFSTPEDADDFKGECEQEWKDRELDDGTSFRVVLTTFYG